MGYPDRLLARVANLVGLKPGDAVLDLGCGTGMLGIGFARLGMNVTAMDPEPDMLAATKAAADAAGVTVNVVQGASHDLAPGMGPFGLVAMGRSFHWVDRAATLDTLDRMVTPDGGVALFHDSHPPVEENGWFKILCGVQDKFGRTGNEAKGGHRRYEPFLFASAFSQIDGMSVTIRNALTAEEIVGRALSMSRCAPQKLGARQEAFEAELTAALRELSPDGTFTEVAELVAVLARRPKPPTALTFFGGLMLQQILTGQAKGVVLLAVAAVLFLYMLPAVIAFARAQRRFYVILVLNILVSVIQSLIARFLFPSLLVIDPHDLAAMLNFSALVTFGPGWLLLLVWSLRPGARDPRLERFQQTKTYDTITALPLILWFAYGVLQLRAALVYDWTLMMAGTAGLFIWVQFVSLSMAVLFDLLLVYLLVVRDRAVGRSRGVWPRFFGVAGTFMGVGILQLPVAQMGLPLQVFAAVLIGVGSLGSALVLWRLGKSFSIMPEARKLVTGGPYAYVRHPLYSVEIITILGTALQFAPPQSWIIAGLVVLLLWIRSHFEEQVLAENFPEYGAYRAQDKRFIPGIFYKNVMAPP